MDHTRVKKCLQFVQKHFDHLRQAPEGKDPNFYDDKVLGEEFEKLNTESEALLEDPDYARLSGQLDINTRKNRYRDILPYDESRVRLTRLAHDKTGHSTYINASFVKGTSGEREYIASQGPLPKTVGDFWRMIWENKVQTVVMACNEVDGGKKKCERYWPTELNTAEKFADNTISVVMVNEDRRDNGDYVIRQLQATAGSETLSVKHCHYTAWPDHGIPRSMDPILDLLTQMRKYQEASPSPIIVHCSAGCGRTGTLIALDYIKQMVVQGKLGEQLNVYDMCLQFRKQRMAFIQTEDQYEMVYRGTIRLLEDFLSHSTKHLYINVDIKKKPNKKETQSLESMSALADSIMDTQISDISPPPVTPKPVTATRPKLRPDQGPSYDNVSVMPSKIFNDKKTGKSIITFSVSADDIPSPTKPAIAAKPTRLPKTLQQQQPKTLFNKLSSSSVEYTLAGPMSKPQGTPSVKSGGKLVDPKVIKACDEELEYSVREIPQTTSEVSAIGDDEIEYTVPERIPQKSALKPPIVENGDPLYATPFPRSPKLSSSSRSKSEAEPGSKTPSKSSVEATRRSLTSTSTTSSSVDELYAYADPQDVNKHPLQKIARGYEQIDFRPHVTEHFPGANNEGLSAEDFIYSKPRDGDLDSPPEVPVKTKQAFVDLQQQSDNISIKSDDKTFPAGKPIKAILKGIWKGHPKDQGHTSSGVDELRGDKVMYKGKNIAMPNRVGNLAGVKSMPANLKSLQSPSPKFRAYKP